MKLTITLETRFVRTPDQRIWSETGSDYSFWQRYLNVFDLVEVVARIKDVDYIQPKYSRADVEKVTFISLPCYDGPYQYLSNAVRIDKIMKNVIERSEAVLLRVPGQISNSIFRHIKNKSQPYGVEVVGDPFDVFSAGSIDHPLRTFFRWWFTKKMCEQCKNAVGASYVTENKLQQRYPNNSFRTSYSSIDISDDVFVDNPKNRFRNRGIFKIVFVGSLEQLYKGPDILIETISKCKLVMPKILLKIIGDGKYRHQLEQQVQDLDLHDTVCFTGQLPPGETVRREMLSADLFVLPSRTEGLPRAMIEAMACALPCIGSAVGGIPELLPLSDLVPPGDAQALADKIIEVLSDPERMRAMSARNLEKAKEYQKDILDQRRREFYLHLRNQTEVWLQTRKACP